MVAFLPRISFELIFIWQLAFELLGYPKLFLDGLEGGYLSAPGIVKPITRKGAIKVIYGNLVKDAKSFKKFEKDKFSASSLAALHFPERRVHKIEDFTAYSSFFSEIPGLTVGKLLRQIYDVFKVIESHGSVPAMPLNIRSSSNDLEHFAAAGPGHFEKTHALKAAYGIVFEFHRQKNNITIFDKLFPAIIQCRKNIRSILSDHSPLRLVGDSDTPISNYELALVLKGEAGLPDERLPPSYTNLADSPTL